MKTKIKFSNYTFIFKFLPIILFILLPISLQANSLFTYKETQTENTKSPIIYKLQTYNDNKIVACIVRINSFYVEDNKICVNKYLSLCTIYPDGNVVPIDITLDIQDFNFCVGVDHDPLTIFSVGKEFLLVAYTEAMDLDNVYTYSA